MTRLARIRLSNPHLKLLICSGPDPLAKLGPHPPLVVALGTTLMLSLLLCARASSRTTTAEPGLPDVTSGPCLTSGQALWLLASEGSAGPREADDQDRQHKPAGDQQAVIARLWLAWDREPQNGDYAQALTLIYIESKEYRLAETVIARYALQCGSTALTYALKSELHFQQRQYDAAYGEAQESVRISAQNPRMHELLGLILIVRGDYLAARPELEIAARQVPGSPQIRYFYGRTLFSTGRYAEALREFLVCLKLDSKHVRALENLGLCYEALREFTKAGEAYEEAIKLRSAERDSKDVEAYSYYGALLAKLGQNAEATVILQKALAINPRNFRANYELGKLFLDHGDLRPAENYLMEAVKLCPTFSQTYYLIGRMYVKQHRFPDAARYFAVFQQLNSNPASREFPFPKN